MGKDKKKKEKGKSFQIEIDIDCEEKAEVLEAFLGSVNCVSNEELRKRLQTDEDKEASSEPFE